MITYPKNPHNRFLRTRSTLVLTLSFVAQQTAFLTRNCWSPMAAERDPLAPRIRECTTGPSHGGGSDDPGGLNMDQEGGLMVS